jgi:hypothetical protein
MHSETLKRALLRNIDIIGEASEKMTDKLKTIEFDQLFIFYWHVR